MGGVTRQPLRRGQIWWAWLDPLIGSEQAGRRPLVVVSTNELLVGPTAIVVPLSTRLPDPIPSFIAVLPKERSGLAEDSGAYGIHIRAISTQRLVRQVGHELSVEDMRAIDAALLYALGLEDAA